MKKIDLLSDNFTAKLDKFTLRAKFITDGFLIGLHKSPYHGFSAEFSDHRQYIPGDSIKNIDWKVYARTGKYYIKRFEEETNLRSYLLIDHSKSMGFSSGKTSKLEYAKAISSALAYLMISQQDAVSLVGYTNKITNYLPPKAMKSYLHHLYKNIFHLQPEDETNSAKILHSLAERLKKRGLIIIFSDLLDDVDSLFSGLQHFRHKKHEVILFHLQDTEEINWNYQNNTEFIDLETNEKIKVIPNQIKKDYLERRENFIKKIKSKCFNSNIEYNPITTNTNFEDVLLKYLIKRKKLF